MALPTTGALSLNAIHIEAGGATGTLCTINDEDIRALIGKASGTAMSFSEWYGASSLIINFNGGSVIDNSPNGQTAVASISFNPDGTITTQGFSYSNIGWASPTSAGVGSDYQILATRSFGVTPSGTLNSWLTLSSTRTWSVTDTTADPVAREAGILFQIRKVGTTTVLDSATITLSAEQFGFD